MAGSGREMETDGFQVVSLSPRRLRERKRACRGLGMADDSPSPSPNPTPLPSPFEPVRDDQVARAPRAVGVPQGTSRVPLASARRLHACCGRHVSVRPSRLHLPPGLSPHTCGDATRLRRVQFPAPTPWTTNLTPSARCTRTPWTPGRAHMQTWARQAMWRRAIAWRELLQAPTLACFLMSLSMARLVTYLSERLRSIVRRSMSEKRQLLLRAQPLCDTVH